MLINSTQLISGEVLFLYSCLNNVKKKILKSEILKMLVISVNIYVGRDFRKWFSPIPLLQAGLMSTLEQAACGLLQSSYSWCLTRDFPACAVPLCWAPGKCAQCSTQFSSQAAFKRLWDQSWVTGAVTSDCALPVHAWKPFAAHSAFLHWERKGNFTAKESKCSL